VNSADALAGPGLLALLIVILVGCVLAALSRRGAVLALISVAILVAANLLIANNVSAYGGLGAIIILALGIFGLIPILISWRVGSFLRDKARVRRDGERARAPG
jgi:hypothetical protein